MQKRCKYGLSATLFVFLFLSGFGQEEKKILHEGNKSYYGGKVMKSANYYKQALDAKPTYYKANFNLGDALYRTADEIRKGKLPVPNKRMTPDSAANIVLDQAAEQFEVVAKSVSNPDTIQKAWHNYGNARLQQKNYQDAILGYKKSLKLNPKDEESRYNLAYAQRKLKEQQKNQDQNKKDQKQQDKQQEKDKKNVNNPNNQEQEQPQNLSKEQAEQMLNALKNSEKNNQKLREKKGEPGQKRMIEKDW